MNCERRFLFKTFFVVVRAALLCGITDAKLPADIKKCHAGDVNCIAQTINDVVKRYPQGNPELGLSSFENVQIKNIVASQATGETPVQLNLKFNTLTLHGLETSVVDKVVGFERDPLKSKYEVHSFVPLISVSGDYEANGKILFMTLNSKGRGDVDLRNVRTVTKIKMGTEQKDGREYLRIRKSQTVMTPEKMHVNMENLFAGNKELTESVNGVINQNWKDIWNELQDGFNNATTIVIRGFLDKIMSTLPYDEYYLSD